MTLKQTRILAVFIIFILNFFFHFGYDWLPNTLFSIFFPVNESIFEHMKMIFSSVIFYGIIDYFILKKNNINTNSIIFSTLITSLSTVGIFLIIWLPLFYKLVENMFLTITMLFISIVTGQIINYFLIKKEIHFRYSSIISTSIIILIYVVLAYLTYNPPKIELFFDSKEEKYGINTYVVG